MPTIHGPASIPAEFCASAADVAAHYFSIYGHRCRCSILQRHASHTYDVEVLECVDCPTLVGRCFRVSGLES